MINELHFTVLCNDSYYSPGKIGDLSPIYYLKDLINNYRIVRKKFPKNTITIDFEILCRECNNLKQISEYASIKKCKELWKKYLKWRPNNEKII